MQRTYVNATGQVLVAPYGRTWEELTWEERFDHWFRPYKYISDEEVIRVAEDESGHECSRVSAWNERIERGHADPKTGMPLEKPEELRFMGCDA
jgi:hypothetical protein